MKIPLFCKLRAITLLHQPSDEVMLMQASTMGKKVKKETYLLLLPRKIFIDNGYTIWTERYDLVL